MKDGGEERRRADPGAGGGLKAALTPAVPHLTLGRMGRAMPSSRFPSPRPADRDTLQPPRPAASAGAIGPALTPRPSVPPQLPLGEAQPGALRLRRAHGSPAPLTARPRRSLRMRRTAPPLLKGRGACAGPSGVRMRKKRDSEGPAGRRKDP